MVNLWLGRLFYRRRKEKRKAVYVLDIVIISWKMWAWSYVRQVVAEGEEFRGKWFILLLIHLFLDFCIWTLIFLGWDCLFVCAVLSPVALSFWGGIHSHPNMCTGFSWESFRDLWGKVIDGISLLTLPMKGSCGRWLCGILFFWQHSRKNSLFSPN